MIRLFCALALTLLLAGCGGGGGGSSTPSNPPAPPRNEPPLFLYFGVVGKQLEETADHINGIYLLDWGDWGTPAGRIAIADLLIVQLTEARARGIKKAVVAVGFLLFDAQHAYHATAELAAFRSRLAALGLLDMVCGLSLLDEPDMLGISDATMCMAMRDTKAVWPDVKLWIIYGDHGTPGISEADIVGHDDYSKAEGVLAHLPGLRAGQAHVLIPGGSDPWRNDPRPFVTFLLAHNEVAALMPFVWFDRIDEQNIPRNGIGSNGMLSAYRSAAQQVTTSV